MTLVEESKLAIYGGDLARAVECVYCLVSLTQSMGR